VVEAIQSAVEEKSYPTARMILPSGNPPRVSYEDYQDGIYCGDLASKSNPLSLKSGIIKFDPFQVITLPTRMILTARTVVSSF
jgi:hypothetical protein